VLGMGFQITLAGIAVPVEVSIYTVGRVPVLPALPIVGLILTGKEIPVVGSVAYREIHCEDERRCKLELP